MAPNPKLQRCPHCGSDADVRPSADVRYKCDLCGKARIPIDASLVPRSPDSDSLLKDSQRSRFARIAWQLAGVGLGAVAAFTALFALAASAAFDFGWVANTSLGVLALIPMVISFLAFTAAKKAGNQSQLRLDEAWQRAAARVFTALGGQVTAKQLAQALGIEVDYATQLLAEAEVQHILATELEEEPQRVRVAPADDVEAEALAELDEALGHARTEVMRTREE